MRISIHQPHYFPWLGYFDKMAKVDKFVLLDEVQLTDKSNMFRNKFMSKSGKEKYLTVCFIKKGYMQKSFKAVELNNEINWQRDHVNFIKDNYRKSEFYDEIWPYVLPILEKKYRYLSDVSIDSLMVLKNLLNINTEIILQSEISYDINAKNNDLVLNICKETKANQYLSGNGARKYMNLDLFIQEDIQVEYQQFNHPIYNQINSLNFTPNLSGLDMLFNCGIEKSREIFWRNVKSVNEFEERN
jgi:hypothetical protein